MNKDENIVYEYEYASPFESNILYENGKINASFKIEGIQKCIQNLNNKYNAIISHVLLIPSKDVNMANMVVLFNNRNNNKKVNRNNSHSKNIFLESDMLVEVELLVEDFFNNSNRIAEYQLQGENKVGDLFVQLQEVINNSHLNGGLLFENVYGSNNASVRKVNGKKVFSISDCSIYAEYSKPNNEKVKLRLSSYDGYAVSVEIISPNKKEYGKQKISHVYLPLISEKEFLQKFNFLK